VTDQKDEIFVAKLAKLERLKNRAKEIVRNEIARPEILMTSAYDVRNEKLKTVFGGRLVRGSFQLMVGPGEVGKGFCSIDLVARLTTGTPFPDEPTKRRSPMSVVVCVTEDSASRVKARLIAAEANLKMVYFVDGPPILRGGLMVPSPVAFDNDAGALLDKIKDIGAEAIFLETTVEHLGDRERKTQWSTNNEFEVRRAMSPLTTVCREGGLIGWGVMHPRKSVEGGIEDSITGSAAFRNVSRGVLHVLKDPSEKDEKDPWRLLATSKSNYLHHRPATLKFKIEPWANDPDEGKVVWGIEGRTLVDDRSAENIWKQLQDSGKKRRDYEVQDAERILTRRTSRGVQ
jgi:hypothetical protein